MESMDLVSRVTCECDGAEQGVFSLARIEAGVLYDDRYIRFDETGKISVVRDRLRIIEIVKADMPRSPSRHKDPVWPDRVTIGIKDCNADVGVSTRCIQQTNCFMAGHLRRGTVTASWDITLCDSPSFASDTFHMATA